MTYPEKLHRVSSVLMLVGACLNKVQFLPIPIIQLPCTLLSLIVYFIGYSCWYIASANEPSTPRLKTKWYGYTEFKNQIKSASSLGLLAVLFCALSIVFPPAIILGMWLFVASNTVWLIGEFHKYKNPPQHELNYSSERQKKYLQHVYFISLLSVITASFTTIAIVFPIAASLTFILMVTSSIVITLTASIYLFDYQFGDYSPDVPIQHSYNNISKLSNGKASKLTHHSSLDKALHFDPLFPRASSCSTLISNSAELEEDLLKFSPMIS